MLELPETFEPENETGNTLIPPGEYSAQVVEARVEQPKSGDGYYVLLVWKITEGEHEGRQLWQRITYVHSSAQSTEIGRKTLKDLCTALGINEHIESVEPFLFKPARIKVGIETDRNGQYDDKNKVSRILPPLASTPTKPQDPAPQTQAKPAPAGKPTASTPTTKGPARPASAGPAPWHSQQR